MAVTKVNQVAAQRRGSIDKLFTRHYYKQYRVLTNDALTDEATVLEVCGNASPGPDTIPTLWQVHPVDPGAYVVSIDAVQESQDDGRSWLVLCSYETAQPEQNPLFAPPVPSWGVQKITYTPDYDVFGQAIVNTAKVPYDPGLEATASFPTLSVQVNQVISPNTWNLMAGSVNLDYFQGFPPYAALFAGCQGTASWYTDPNTELEIFYWQNTFSFEFNTSTYGFRTYVASRGYQQLVNNKLEQVVEDDGSLPTSPVFLDEDGARVPAGGTPYFQTFYLNNLQFFAAFGLPDFTFWQGV